MALWSLSNAYQFTCIQRLSHPTKVVNLLWRSSREIEIVEDMLLTFDENHIARLWSSLPYATSRFTMPSSAEESGSSFSTAQRVMTCFSTIDLSEMRGVPCADGPHCVTWINANHDHGAYFDLLRRQLKEKGLTCLRKQHLEKYHFDDSSQKSAYPLSSSPAPSSIASVASHYTISSVKSTSSKPVQESDFSLTVRRERIERVLQLIQDYMDILFDLQSDGSLVLWAIEVGHILVD